MTDDRLAELDRLAAAATPPPWTAHYTDDQAADWVEAFDCRTPEAATGGYVFRMPDELVLHVRSDPEPPEPGEVIVPDQGVMVAGKRAVNRGIDLGTGEPVGEEWLDLKPHDAAFVAAARQAVPELVAEVRRMRAELAAERERIAVLADAVGATYRTAEPNPDGPGEVVTRHAFADRIREGS